LLSYSKALWGRTRLNRNSVKANCYSGHTYAERPQFFWWQDIEYEVKEIEKSWQEPGKRYFHVFTTDNKSFQLCYNEMEKQWSLIELVRG
jgi:hypothetical protein